MPGRPADPITDLPRSDPTIAPTPAPATVARFEVVVVGSANLDLVATTDRLPGPGETVLGTAYAEHAGGKGLNQAVAAARAGARVAFVGAVGVDPAGDRLIGVVESDGIDATHVVRCHDLPTGRALITVDRAAENSIVVVPGANGAVVPPAELPRSSVVLVQLEIPLDTVVEVCRSARSQPGCVTVLNPAPAMPLPDELLACCDVIVPNEHELELAGGIDRLLSAGVAAVIVTRGAAGLTVHTAADVVEVPSLPVEAVDTTGAGDACCGTIAARLAAGDDVVTAARRGAAAGAAAATVSGAVPSLPTDAEVTALIARIGQ